MKRLVMILAMFTLGAAAPAIAQTTTPKGSPAERPAPGTPHPPENRMEQVVPDMKSDKKEQHPPTNRVGEAVLLTLVGLDATGLAAADPQWLGRGIASLRRIGLAEDARRLAVEAAIVNGL